MCGTIATTEAVLGTAGRGRNGEERSVKGGDIECVWVGMCCVWMREWRERWSKQMVKKIVLCKSSNFYNYFIEIFTILMTIKKHL